MSFYDPPTTSPLDTSSPDPYLVNASDNLKLWQQHWSRRANQLAGVDPDAIRQTAYWDQQRVLRGSPPLSDRAAQQIVQAVQSGKQTVPGPKPHVDWWNPIEVGGAAVEDLKNIVTGLPRFPGVVINEMKKVASGEASKEITTALGKGDYAAALRAPGVNLIPGSFTLSNLVEGNPQALVEHPVMTALDVTPYIHKLGLGEAAVKAATESKVLGPKIAAVGQWADARGFGPEARRLQSQLMMGGRGAALERSGDMAVLAKEFAAMPPEVQDTATQWLQHRKLGEQPPPEMARAVKLAEQIQRIGVEAGARPVDPELLATVDKNGKPSTLRVANEPSLIPLDVGGTTEIYANTGKARSAAKLRAKADTLERQAADIQQGPLNTYQARAQAATEARVALARVPKPTDVADQVDGLIREASDRATARVNEMASQLPPRPGAAPVELHPGEQAYLESGPTPVGQVRPEQVVQHYTPSGRSATLDELRQRIVKEKERILGVHRSVNDEITRLGFEGGKDWVTTITKAVEGTWREGVEPGTRKVAERASDFADEVARLQEQGVLEHMPPFSEKQAGPLYQLANAVFKAPEFKGMSIDLTRLTDNLVGEVSDSLLRTIEDRVQAMRTRLIDTDAPEAFIEKSEKALNTIKEYRKSWAEADKGAMKLYRAKAKQQMAEAVDPAYQKIYDELIVPFKAELARSQEAIAQAEELMKAEQARVGQAAPRTTTSRMVHPAERRLTEIYRELDAYRAGQNPTLDQPSNLPEADRAAAAKAVNMAAGSTQLDDLLVEARRLEAQGVRARPPSEKLAARGTAAVREADWSKLPGVGEMNTAAHLYGELTAPDGPMARATERFRAGDIQGGRAALREARKTARALTKLDPLYPDQLIAKIDEALKASAKDPRRMTQITEDRIAKSTARVEATRARITDRQQQAAALRETADKMLARTPPARFIPLLREKLDLAMKEAAVNAAKESGDPAALEQVGRQQYAEVLGPSETRRIFKEVGATWQQLRDEAGYDPLYVHEVAPGQLGSMFAKTLDVGRIPTPGQWKPRNLDYSSSVGNLEMRLNHALYELSRRRWVEYLMFGAKNIDVPSGESPLLAGPTREFLPGFVRSKLDEGGFSFTRSELVDRHADDIATFARKKGLLTTSGEINWQLAIDEYLNKHYAVLRPFDYIPWARKMTTTRMGSSLNYVTMDGTVLRDIPAEVYVTKGVKRIIDQAIPDVGSGMAITRAYDKALNVFRVSALAFSPRFHIYNVIGGGAMLLARTDPSVFKYLGDARDMIGSFKDFEQPTVASALDSEFAKLGSSAPGAPLPLSAGGVVVPDFASRITKDPYAAARAVEGFKLGQIWKGVKSVADISFKLNEYVDGMYRTMAYLYGTDKALTKGMSTAEAQVAGVKLANTILQDWDKMLPFERTIMRRIIPFYGWVRHIARYVLTYPFDHPWRASMVAALSRAEQADWGSDNALPERFKSMLFLGDPNPTSGNQLSFNLGGVNPFSSVADYFSWGGLVASLSPAFQAVLESRGINLMSGSSQLYPEITYNPDTGQLEAKGQPLGESLLKAFIPQSEAVLGMTGLSQNMNQIAQRDPEQWKSLVLASIGVPGAPRQRSKSKEIMLDELRRDQAAADALRRAIKTGNWSEADRYTLAAMDVNNDGKAELVPVQTVKELLAAQQRGSM